MAKDEEAGRRPAGRRRGRHRPRGRQVEPEALEEIRTLLGDAPRERALLIEHLHRIRDRFGHLSARHLAALAAEMRLAMAEVYEVATFYAHFDVTREDTPAPPETTLRVCDGLPCELAGSGELRAALEAAMPGVRVLAAPCMGRCNAAPAVALSTHGTVDDHVDRATPERVRAALEAGPPALPAPASGAEAAADHRRIRACLDGEIDRERVIAMIGEAGLRGMGGAGFPAVRKWDFVRAGAAPRHLAVNADEGEPGTFKDRLLLETRPRRVLEGALIAAWAVEADTVTVYLRDEYPLARRILAREIEGLGDLAPPGGVRLRRGAPAYICGEESAMLESIEGKRGMPRHRPPYVAEVGLHGRPTLVHNVETLYWVSRIVEKGAAWFAGAGRHGGQGFRAYSVSGRVREPGVRIVPAGTTARELVAESGGMAPGHAFKAYLPGGASGGILPERLADLPLDFGKLEEHGCFTGSGAVVILSDRDDMRLAALNLMRFFAHESCGQCTPCRVGTEKASRLMADPRWDRALLEDLAEVMAEASICGLGQAAPNPLRSVMAHFPEEAGLAE